MTQAEASLIIRREGAVGHLTMNRPRALNALDLAMIDGFAAALAEWRDAPEVRMVLLEGAGDRAFCAGGDVRRCGRTCWTAASRRWRPSSPANTR
ncbi:enoyl-CoA hydratase/isomerase family protein [Teichococcus aestuarii]|uniref:enoyl-CoA hydratase/isomerase family protein n=1 Tax=Teichococcus aestuarii TaxID=568898 RepID=UPI003623DEF6